jgi:membrane protein
MNIDPKASQKVGARLQKLLWRTDPAELDGWRRNLLLGSRVTFAIGRDLVRGELNLWAMSLVYTTLLALVPLLAISFSVLKGFGAHNAIEPLLLEMLTPLGDQGIEISRRIIEFVENMKVGVLGSIGFAMLFYTVVSLMQKIERAFNKVWHVRISRSFAQRFRDYLSVLVIGPVLVFSAMGMSATIMNASVVESLAAMQPLGTILHYLGRLLPFAMIVGAFTFMYAFIPNTKVDIRAAFTGGLISGVMWNSIGWIFASFIVGSAKYTAIYSAFATLIFFMIWIYIAWLILLIGVSIAFYTQNPAFAFGPDSNRNLSPHGRDALALAVLGAVAQRYFRQEGSWSLEQLSEHLQQRSDNVADVVSVLDEIGILKASADEPATYLPARPFDELTVGECLLEFRKVGLTGPAGAGIGSAATSLLSEAEEAAAGRLRDISLKEFGLGQRADIEDAAQ